ncbi:MAG: penicillin acylase family protein [Candidatus Competibacteraceae bacterium]|nr:penicillin acylase family protein [Candidatus Competibacteraceae bacterium]
MIEPLHPSLNSHPRWRRWLARTGIILLVLPVGGILWAYLQLHGSLPQLDGTVDLVGLGAPVTVARDALGIPTIRGANRLDVARASGFLHAQERFFQMDLLRRTAAGELAALFGAMALDFDRANRLHRFRHRARQILEKTPAADQALLAAYVAGVNAGLRALSATPFEYLLLQATPEPWQPEDSLLVVYAMYLDLQGQQWARESARGLLHEKLPTALAAFLDPLGTDWDAPLQGEPLPSPPIPGPEIFDLRRQPAASIAPAPPLKPAFTLFPGLPDDASETVSGSNNWAVSGELTAHGAALLANDMHLALRVPTIWYRAALVFPEGDSQRRVDGVMLPGTPAIVAGSNGHMAWGYTNSQGDWADLVLLEFLSDNDRYATPNGPKTFERIQEILSVKDGPPQTLEILQTVWGPVVDRDHQGRQRALRWVAHDLKAVNLGLLALEGADTLETALYIANRAGAPTQNFLVASADGRIAWSLSGPMSHRFGHDGRLPSSWADGQRGWDGWLEPVEYPRLVDPPSGRLWTANNRVTEGLSLQKIGDGGYAHGARARQIRDSLQERSQFNELDFLKLQLDDRALFLERWRQLLLATLTPEAIAANPQRQEVRRWAVDWGGRAAVDSVGYRLVKLFREQARDRAFAPLIAACRQADPHFDYGLIRQHEGPLWELISQRPPHLLDPRYADWSALLLAAADATHAKLIEDGRPLAAHTWGDQNRALIQHPFSRAIPWLSAWLDMPVRSLPGDQDMPRVQTRNSGASERLVVAPGREMAGILHLPGGQSGHPLSPFYRAGFDAWATGEASPLLPGAVQYRLELQPASD